MSPEEEMCNMIHAFIMMVMTLSIPCKHNLKVHNKLLMTILKVHFHLSGYWTIPHFPPWFMWHNATNYMFGTPQHGTHIQILYYVLQKLQILFLTLTPVVKGVWKGLFHFIYYYCKITILITGHKDDGKTWETIPPYPQVPDYPINPPYQPRPPPEPPRQPPEPPRYPPEPPRQPPESPMPPPQTPRHTPRRPNPVPTEHPEKTPKKPPRKPGKPDTCDTSYDAISVIRREVFIFKGRVSKLKLWSTFRVSENNITLCLVWNSITWL